MDHLDLALNMEQEAVYGDGNDEGGGEMSDRVSTLASSIYAEFERMIKKYGSDVVENLMPMLVNVLEQLDSSYSEGNEQSVELELLAEDNEQLMTQYEREKQLRKLTETKYLEYEDSREQDKQGLQNIIDQLEHARKQGENKIKQLQDQVDRTEERLLEQKKEYATLHTRHTEMLHAYMERMEMSSKLSPSPATPDNVFAYRKQHDIAQGLISISQPNLLSAQHPDSVLRSTPQTSIVSAQHGEISESRNDLSFEDEIDIEAQVNESEVTLSTTKVKKKLSADTARSIIHENVDTNVVVSGTQSIEMFSDLSKENIERIMASAPLNTIGEHTELFSVSNIENNDVIADISSDAIVSSPEVSTSSEMFLSPEAKAILHSTPELMKSKSRINELKETPTIDIQKVEKQRHHDVSLFAELQSLNTMSLGEVDTTGDVLTVDQKGLKEFDILLTQNKELMDVRNKLQTQKNDLLRHLEEVTSDKEIQEEEISGLHTTKTRMKLKISELEQILKKVRLEHEKAQITLKNKVAEERISSANRKRFTRVEMAKVLMERNQYKERLMELQEAVRWTEMIRASKENHLAALQQKKKSSIWRLFSNLFAGTGNSANTSPKKGTPQQPINVWYGSQSTSVQRRHSSAVSNTSSTNSSVNHPSRYSVDSGFEGLTERQRQERKERYKFVKEHINSEGRKQAYGWSLPANYSGDQSGPMAVPVPVYCRPLNTEPAMKIWCAAGIDLEGGKNADGKYIGLPADFKEPLKSTVWIGTSTHSCSKVTIIDANNPSNALDQFIVSSSHLLCMAPVAGFIQEDLKSEKFNPPADLPRALKSGSQRQTASPEHAGSVMGIQAEEESFPDDDSVDGSSALKVTSLLPTMWLGAQSGKVYIHSVISGWKKCLQSAKLKDSLLSIVYTHGRVLAALADGTVAIFHRKPDGRWDLSNYHLLDLGRPHHSIRCMTPVHDYVWCGYRNKVQVINPNTMKIEKSFDAHPRRESQVRQLACIGDGVWVSIRLDSTLRLYNAHTYHHLQDVDIEPYVSKMLGTGKFGFSFVRITALLLTDDRLWVGTGNGIILSVPLVSARPSRESETEVSKMLPESAVTTRNVNGIATSLFMPYCAMVHAQLSFHGHRDSVKFFIAVPGSAANVEAAKAYSMAGARPPSPSNVLSLKESNIRHSLLVMSGGEGYIDFRVGDDESVEENPESIPLSSKVVAVERSHLLVWQIGSSN